LLLWDLLAGDDRARELGLVATPLALYVAWTGVSLLWTRDVHGGAIEVLAFYVPFTLLAVSIARLPWQTLGMRAVYLLLTLMGLGFAIVGFSPHETSDTREQPT